MSKKAANMPRAVRLLQSALDTVGDRRALGLLRPPQHLRESFPRNQVMVTTQNKAKNKPNESLLKDKHNNNKSRPDSDFQLISSSGGGEDSPTSQLNVFPSIVGVRKRFVTSSTVIIFNLALCYHFGRGIEQVNKKCFQKHNALLFSFL
jgi:hypothetical protein